jgi:hypothetical protein
MRVCAVAPLAVLFLLVGCSNPYSQFYKGAPDAKLIRNYETPQPAYQVYSTNQANYQRDVDNLLRKGYQMCGESSFQGNSNQSTDGPVKSQAQKLGASLVLVTADFSHTVSGMAPVVTPTTSTTFSSGSATAFGPGGTATAFGTGQSTTFGTETTMVPYTISRSDFHAFFWYKAKRSRLGIAPIPLDDSTRQRLGSNAGIIVRTVVEETTAYAADILPGDIVTSIGGDTVYSVEAFYKLLDKYEDQEPIFVIDRSGNKIQKNIKILALAK